LRLSALAFKCSYMSNFRFILQSIRFYWRQHIAVFAATLISTAVLTGALIVGDSVRYSLKRIVEKRLGGVRLAMQTGDRFVRARLASDLSDALQSNTAALLMLQGVAINPDLNQRVNRVQVVGFDSSFFDLNGIEIVELKPNEAIISRNTSQRLNIEVGREFLLRVENAEVIPINTPFVKDNPPSVSLRVKVVGIVDDESFGRFSLKSNQVAPYNVFVSREFLADQMDLTGKANVVLVGDVRKQVVAKSKNDKDSSLCRENRFEATIEGKLNSALSAVWQLDDAGIKINEMPETSEYEVQSERVFIDDPISSTIQQSELSGKGVLTYLVNSIKCKGSETPYSFVAASAYSKNLTINEILINEWLAADLNAKVGDSVALKYFVIGAMNRLHERTSHFIVKGIVPVDKQPYSRSLMPMFPGLSDAASCSEWEAGIPIDLEKIRRKDEDYWNRFRGTPKAYISIESGLSLWKGSYVGYSALRFDKGLVNLDTLKGKLLFAANPRNLGLSFQPVFDQGMQSVNGSVDFGELFISLSFFVIAAGILLMALIYSLNTDSRMGEVGLLSSLGFSRRRIQWLRFAESFAIALAGGIAGALLGMAYNYGLVKAMDSVWNDIVRTKQLEIMVDIKTLAMGAFMGIAIAMLSIYLIINRKLKQPVIKLIKGLPAQLAIDGKNRFSTSLIVATSAFLTSVVMVSISLANGSSINAGMFLLAGGLFLVGCTAAIYSLFIRVERRSHPSTLSTFELSIKNAARNRNRSLATIALLALGTFSVIITGANRKTFYGVEGNRQSGTGGFLLWVETTMPVKVDLNTADGKEQLGFEPESLAGVEFIQFSGIDGDDASCLNLNQVQRPRILGVKPAEFARRRAFSFVETKDDVDPGKPWLALSKSYGEGIVPAIADQTVLTWGLKKGIGDTIVYLDEMGKPMKLLIVGGLANSVFQGNLLVSDSLIRAHFPSSGGSRVMLVDAPLERGAELADELNATLTDYGIEVTPVTLRLAQFYSVENTYLSVFMILGGLGMLIGTMGLGVVLLRNMADRRGELAALMALGFAQRRVIRLVLFENLMLLLAGLSVGMSSALIGVLPSIVSPAFVMPTAFIAALLLLILISGLTWIYLPVRLAVRGSVVSGLRDE